MRVFGVKAPASTTHHYQFYLDDYETDPSTQPWLLWPLATKLWSIYHEFFAKLTPDLQYAMRLYIDCVLATTEPEDVFRFPLRMSDGPLPLHARVPSQDSLPIEPRLALYHHVDKWIYHSRRLTAAQENRIPYLKLIRRCRPQKFNANKEFVTRDLTENDKRVLRHWTLVTRLGNYRHANVPSLGTSLRERQLAVTAASSTVLTTLACREFLVHAVHDDPALFKTLDQQRHGAWTRYRQATIKAADGYRISAEPPTAYFKETQGDLARLMIPVSFWEATLPLFRRLGVPYDIVSPEFVARMASVFRYAQGRRIEWHKSLIESVPFSQKEKLVEDMTRYYTCASITTTFDWSDKNNRENLDLLYSLCLAQYYAKTVFLVSLESHVLEAQFDALMHRSRGDAEVATKAMQFVACPSCFKEHSMVCRPLPGSSTSSTTTTTTTRRRKRAKVFTASAVAGLSKVRINIHSMEVYCGRKSGKKRSQCMRAPVCRFPLLGQLLCFRGVFYTLCTRPECGIVTVFDPVTSRTLDPVCTSCSSSSSSAVTNKKEDKEEEDVCYYDYSDEDLDPETGEPELYRGVRVKRKYKKKN